MPKHISGNFCSNKYLSYLDSIRFTVSTLNDNASNMHYLIDFCP